MAISFGIGSTNGSCNNRRDQGEIETVSENGAQLVERGLSMLNIVMSAGRINPDIGFIQGMEDGSAHADSSIDRSDSIASRVLPGTVPASTGTPEQRPRKADRVFTSIDGRVGTIFGGMGTRGRIQETLLREIAEDESIHEGTQEVGRGAVAQTRGESEPQPLNTSQDGARDQHDVAIDRRNQGNPENRSQSDTRSMRHSGEFENAQADRNCLNGSADLDSGSEANTRKIGDSIERDLGTDPKMAIQDQGTIRDDLKGQSRFIQKAETQSATIESEGQLLEDVEKVGSMVSSTCFPLPGVPVSMSPSDDDPLASQRAIRISQDREASRVVDIDKDSGRRIYFEGQSSFDKNIQGAETQAAMSGSLTKEFTKRPSEDHVRKI
jgi:hypothetical protein